MRRKALDDWEFVVTERKNKKRAETDSNEPVLGTGAAGDPQHPEVGAKPEQPAPPTGEPAKEEDDHGK